MPQAQAQVAAQVKRQAKGQGKGLARTAHIRDTQAYAWTLLSTK